MEFHQIWSHWIPILIKFSEIESSRFITFTSPTDRRGRPLVFQMFFKNGPFPASFSFFFLSFLHTVNSKQMFNKSCRWLDSNPGPLVLEATALPTAPQPLPIYLIFLHTAAHCIFIQVCPNRGLSSPSNVNFLLRSNNSFYNFVRVHEHWWPQ